MDLLGGETNETYLQVKRRFSDFLHEYQPHASTRYFERLGALLAEEQAPGKNARLLIDVHDVRQFDEKLHDNIIKEPCESFRPCLDAARDAAKGLDDGAVGKKYGTKVEALQIGFTGELGYHKVSPRKLLSTFLNKMVTVVGIVTKCTLVHPKLVKSVHYCKATNKFTTRNFTDETNVDGVPATSNAMPTRDENQNLLTTEIGLCHFIDNQRVTLQELPETAPPGQLPRSTEFVLEGDLVDACKPGDRVMITGVYRPLAGKASATLGAFRSVVVVNSVEQLSHTTSAASEITPEDLKEMKRLAATENVLDVLGKSMAPSIYGHEWIKKALVLLLVGGQEKVLSNKTHLRGDINCLLVGDPGVAKSQLLRAVMNVAPLAISTNGRGSSGVGLTAAVTTDQETGDRRLEAGAVVLADRGLVCVDEFDKMSDMDRVAIHEVMEQQTVTISKAGIHTSLNARCSIVAAANPIYGNIDETISLTRNINLPDSLLSRFDLLFVVRDNTNEHVDLNIASHVLQQHQYRAGGDDGTLAPAVAEELLEQDEDEGGEPPRYLEGTGSDDSEQQLLTVAFLRKYIFYCKSKFAKQLLTQEAFEDISQFYVEIRQLAASGIVDPRFRPIPVTARLLETTIRVATAHSKLRFSRKIEKADVVVARDLLLRVVDQAKRTTDEPVGDDIAQEADGMADVPARVPETRRQTRSRVAQQDDAADENVSIENTARVGQKRTTSGTAAMNPPRKQTPTVVLNAELETSLYNAVSAMLVDDRYVDEWKIESVQKWLAEKKSLEVPVNVLEEYFDRVDQNLTAQNPHVLYDVAEKSIHRDY